MKHCVIFGAGAPPLGPVALPENALLIAADGGLVTMRKLGLTPDLFVGDRDSLRVPVPEGVESVLLPVKKDVTDMDAAATAGLERGCRAFTLYGGMGGRLDHTLANISLLARLSKQGCEAAMTDGRTTVYALTNGSLTLPARKTGDAAVFSFTEKSEGVTIEGLLYPLENGTLTADFALGVSNSFCGNAAKISLESGTLIVVPRLPEKKKKKNCGAPP